MSLVEGGGWTCYTHDFETNDVNKWNKHCSDGEHFEYGTTYCRGCNAIICIDGLPYEPYVNGTKPYTVKCEDCDTDSKFTKVKKEESK
jgi:hypothetical protein